MNSITRRHFIGTTLLATAGSLALPSISRAQGSPIRIGLITSLSGPQEIYGRQVRLGAEIAVDQLNAQGGINGQRLELVPQDDKGTPNDAVFAARELAGQKVNFFLGGLYTPIALALSAIMPDLNGVLFSLGSLSVSLTHENFNRNYFRLNDNNFIRCNAQAKLIAERFSEAKKWRGLLIDSATGKDAWAAFSYGMRKHVPNAQLGEPVWFKSGSPDMKPQIAQLLADPADGLYTAGFSGADVITYVQQSEPFRLRDRIEIYMDYGAELAFGEALGKRMLPNFWSASNWYPGAFGEIPSSQALVEEYKRRAGGKIPGSYVGLSHASVFAIAQGVQKAKSSDTPAVISALEGATVKTCRGDITLRAEDHQGLGDVTIIRVDPADKDPGFAVTDFVRVSGAAAVEPPTPGVALDMKTL